MDSLSQNILLHGLVFEELVSSNDYFTSDLVFDGLFSSISTLHFGLYLMNWFPQKKITVGFVFDGFISSKEYFTFEIVFDGLVFAKSILVNISIEKLLPREIHSYYEF